MQLSEAQIGRWVLYTDGAGHVQPGRIKSSNERWVFVVYHVDVCWNRFMDFTGCATEAKDLEYI